MIDKVVYEKMAKEYGRLSSWAVWADQGETPKSNVGNLNIFDTSEICELLNPKFVFVGLNISRGIIKSKWGNFHDPRKESTDYKIRYALKDTPFWGSYMTDLFKDLEEKNSNKVPAYLKIHKEYARTSIHEFRKEILELGSEQPTLIAFGAMVHTLLMMNFSSEFNIVKIPHYAVRKGKEAYRLEVEKLLRCLLI